MGEYYPLNTQPYIFKPISSTPPTHSVKYKLLGQGKENSKINFVEFTHNKPSICAITSGTKVTFYDVEKQEVTNQFTSIKNIANCASYRQDDKLMGIGDDSGLLQIIDTSHRTILRRLKGHIGPVKTAKFLNDKTHIVSGGEDKSLRLWDIAEGKCVNTYSTHTDKIRCVVTSNMMNSPHLFLSGSYDGYLKLWDTRTSDKEVLTFTHSHPVEDIIIYPKSLMCASAGATLVKLWDISTGKIIDSLSNHSKTITSISITNDESKLLTASLDNTTKWVDLHTKNVLKTQFYENEIFCATLSPNNDLIAAGLGDGAWYIKQHKAPITQPAPKPTSLHTPTLPSTHTTKIVGEISASHNTQLEKLLREFNYKGALDLALTISSAHVISLIEELIQRGALYIALGGRDDVTILPFLKFISRNIGTASPHTSIVLESLHTLIEENEWMCKTTDPSLTAMLRRISQVIGFELAQHNQLEEVHGILDMVLTN